MTINTREGTCKMCGKAFPIPLDVRGRPPELCSAECRKQSQFNSRTRYRTTDKYRDSLRRRAAVKRETYDPWLWEHTILEWNE